MVQVAEKSCTIACHPQATAVVAVGLHDKMTSTDWFPMLIRRCLPARNAFEKVSGRVATGTKPIG